MKVGADFVIPEGTTVIAEMYGSVTNIFSSPKAGFGFGIEIVGPKGEVQRLGQSKLLPDSNIEMSFHGAKSLHYPGIRRSPAVLIYMKSLNSIGNALIRFKFVAEMDRTPLTQDT